MSDAASLRERNRRRRNRGARVKFAHIADGAFVAAFIVMCVGWIMEITALFLTAGAVFFVAAALMTYISLKKFLKNPRKSPESKAALWSLIFYAAFAAVGLLMAVAGIVNL